jgi:tRNA pseudouridine55 synthase
MIYLLNKPKGWTSFDLVKKVRNLTGQKSGHAGTLDPLATGLMIVATGRDTKKLHELTGLDKTYKAEFLLGRQTDTADREGKVTRQLTTDNKLPNQKQINQAVAKLQGEHELPVPLYSAVKVNGRPLYWYARNNKQPPRIPTRAMKVLEVRLLDIVEHEFGRLVELEIRVASGVYIRSLAEHLGDMLNSPAMMWNLRRISIGNFSVDDVTTLEKLAAGKI